MTYLRCKCGDLQYWDGGYSPPRCAWCEKCQSDPAPSSTTHSASRTPHDFSKVEHVASDQGPVTITRCRYCLKTRAQIDAAEKSP